MQIPPSSTRTRLGPLHAVDRDQFHLLHILLQLGAVVEKGGPSGDGDVERAEDGDVEREAEDGDVQRKTGMWSERCDNGGRAEGMYVSGKRAGMWSERFPDGRRVEGMYVAGQRAGLWRERFPEGGRGEGMCVAGQRTGLWHYSFPSGNKAERWYEGGKLTRGVHTLASGQVQEGKYEPHGGGKYQRRTGMWSARGSDGGRSEGMYVAGKRAGLWHYSWPNGNKEERWYEDGKQTRKVEYEYEDGKQTRKVEYDASGLGLRSPPDGEKQTTTYSKASDGLAYGYEKKRNTAAVGLFE